MNAWTEVGHAALIVACLLSFGGFALAIIGWRLGHDGLMRATGNAAIVQFGLILISFAALVHGYISSDFSVLNVWQNSHSLQPLIYKFTGTWANHEGSMLLWVTILALFGAGVALFGKTIPSDLRGLTVGVQSLIFGVFALFIVITSNPFVRIVDAPFEGRDLNPILQDIGLAIHPPLLYVGYVGFSITFAFAIAALLLGRLDAAWARWVRPWTLIAWVFLTLGIAMGSYWAYYELGWGGWWFWDPVENASLMPWLVGTAFLHSVLVAEKRGALRIWSVLLAILAFSLSLLGTFLVRSGVLTSVHTFASDPSRGVFILVILMVFIAGGLALFALRAEELKGGKLFQPVSREGALVLNNIFLAVSCGTVLVGTLYPLVYETFTGQKISIGAPYFNIAAGPLFLILLIAMPFGPFLAWKRGELKAVLQRVWGVAAIAAGLAFLRWLVVDEKATLAPLGLAIAFFVVGAALFEPLWRAGLGRLAPGEVLGRLARMPMARWGVALGHAGIGLTAIGVIAVSAWSTERIEVINPEERLTVGGGYAVRFDRLQAARGPTHTETQAIFTLLKNDRANGEIVTARRSYLVREMPTTEAGIVTRGFSQVYLSLGRVEPDGSILVRAYWKPWVTLIWLGALVTSAGGAAALAGYRRRTREREAEPAPAPAPAAPAVEPAE